MVFCRGKMNMSVRKVWTSFPMLKSARTFMSADILAIVQQNPRGSHQFRLISGTLTWTRFIQRTVDIQALLTISYSTDITRLLVLLLKRELSGYSLGPQNTGRRPTVWSTSFQSICHRSQISSFSSTIFNFTNGLWVWNDKLGWAGRTSYYSTGTGAAEPKILTVQAIFLTRLNRAIVWGSIWAYIPFLFNNWISTFEDSQTFSTRKNKSWLFSISFIVFMVFSYFSYHISQQ